MKYMQNASLIKRLLDEESGKSFELYAWNTCKRDIHVHTWWSPLEYRLLWPLRRSYNHCYPSMEKDSETSVRKDLKTRTTARRTESKICKYSKLAKHIGHQALSWKRLGAAFCFLLIMNRRSIHWKVYSEDTTQEEDTVLQMGHSTCGLCSNRNSAWNTKLYVRKEVVGQGEYNGQPN